MIWRVTSSAKGNVERDYHYLQGKGPAVELVFVEHVFDCTDKVVVCANNYFGDKQRARRP